MKIYIPYYDRGWHIQEADADRARRIGRFWLYNSVIYGDTAYNTEAASQAYIDKQYNKARLEEYKPLFA